MGIDVCGIVGYGIKIEREKMYQQTILEETLKNYEYESNVDGYDIYEDEGFGEALCQYLELEYPELDVSIAGSCDYPVFLVHMKNRLCFMSADWDLTEIPNIFSEEIPWESLSFLHDFRAKFELPPPKFYVGGYYC